MRNKSLFRLFRPAFLLATLLAAGCGAIGFDVSQAIPQQDVPGSAAGPITGLLPSFLAAPIPLTINLQEEEAKRNTGPASHAYLSSLTLSATPTGSPSGNFDFLSEVHIFVAPSSGSALPSVEIASVDPVGKGLFELDFKIVPNVDLLPYINAGAQITAQATGTQPNKDFTYDGEIVVNVRI